jgi:hypothetical protein
MLKSKKVSSKAVKEPVVEVKSEEAPAPVESPKHEDFEPSPAPSAVGKDPSGERSLISNAVANVSHKAKVKVGDKIYKVNRHTKRKTHEPYLSVSGGKSVLEADWLSGKADLGLTDAHLA